MSFHQVEEWLEIFRQFGYLLGFILLYIRAVIPAFPLAPYILINTQTYGPILGILISWPRLVSGTFIVYLIYKRLVDTERIQRTKQRIAVQRLISFIDRQGLILLFILLCPPFTPNTLINLVANLSHIRPKYYFIVLASPKLVPTVVLGHLGKEIITILTHPLRGTLMLVASIVFWIVGKKLERYFMGSKKE